jgi:hypothetical protein
MTIEEAWMFWMKQTRSTTDPSAVTDFEVIKKTSWWAAFEAGWNAANSNRDVYEQAYTMGVTMGKELAKHDQQKGFEWVDLTPGEIGELTVFDGLNHIETDILADFVWKVEAKIKEKNL